MLNEEMPTARAVLFPRTHSVWLNWSRGQFAASQPTISARERGTVDKIVDVISAKTNGEIETAILMRFESVEYRWVLYLVEKTMSKRAKRKSRRQIYNGGAHVQSHKLLCLTEGAHAKN